MSFTHKLFSVSVFFCGINYMRGLRVSPEYEDYFDYFIKKEGTDNWTAPNGPYFFEEGLKYIIFCRRSLDYELHWEVEPYGLKSSPFNGSNSDMNTIKMTLKLHRDDDQITIGCYSKKKKIFKEENTSTTFLYWDKIVRPIPPTSFEPDTTNDAEHKCYHKKIEKCVFFMPTKWDNSIPMFEMRSYTRYNHQKSTPSLGTMTKRPRLDIGAPKDEANQYEGYSLNKDVWVSVLAVSFAALLVLCFIRYRFIRKRKPNDPTNTEPPIMYAERQMESDSQRGDGNRNGTNSHQAMIMWLKSKNIVPNLKNTSRNTLSKTEDTPIGTVERINDLYLTVADTQIGTVERINDLYSTVTH